ncbi:UNVERIFIED_CONTAM: hypothetical protein RMT77_007603 [Armadillidium vulgare]
MGEPVEVVEGPDSEISRLFPKCRPRFTLPSTAFVSEINNTNIIQGTAVTSTAADINKNCVSDANDNYQVFPATLEDVTPHRDDSSGCDSSRMSVDSACATTSSTPASHSSSSSSSHTSFATHNYPADEKSNDLNGGGTLNANDDLSVVSAYNDDRFSSTVLDSSFEEANGSTRVMSSPPTIGSSHKRSVVHSVSHNMGNLQNDSHISPQQQQQPQQPQQPQQQQPQQQQQQPTLSLLKREHFRLRDSRIETAGGKEMFSQSRSRPSRKRHEEGRRGIHHASHHFNHNNNSNNNNHHQPLIHHSHHHHHQHAIPQQKHQPGHKQQQSNEYVRKVERSSSRSNSTNSNSSSSSNERGSSESKSEGKEPLDEESEEVSPSRVVSEDVSDNVSSTLVYETRLSGSSEVVFDDISEWVERGLSVRGVENSSLRRTRRGSNNDPQQPFVGTSITPPTPLSRSERDSEYDDEDEDEDDDEDDDDDDSPMRVTRIGSVPIAEYEGSPRRYGQPIRPPRPGFPRRVNNISQDERTRVLINSLEGDKKSAEVLSRNEKSHSSYRHEFRKSKHKSNLYQHEKGESDSPKSSSTQERNNSLNPLGSKENSEKKDTEKDETQNTLDFSQDNNSPVKISISTITSSYASSLPNKTITSSEISSEKNNSNAFEDYRFEDSETRKVLDEFFLESRSKPQEFYDLEYTLKRQHGNSYVGQRLAATECEEEADQPQTEDSYVLQEEIGNPSNEISEKLPSEDSVSDVPHTNQCSRQDVTSTDKKIITGNDSENSQKNIIQENGNSPQDNCEVSRLSSTCTQLNELQISLSHSFKQQEIQSSSNENVEYNSSPNEVFSTKAEECNKSDENSVLDSSRSSPLIDLSGSCSVPDELNFSADNIDRITSLITTTATTTTIISTFSSTNGCSSKNTLELINSFDQENMNTLEVVEVEVENNEFLSRPNNLPIESISQEVQSRVLPGFSDIQEDVSSLPPPLEVDFNEHLEIGVSRNFTLSPETTSCDSLDVESEFSVGDAEGSIPSSGKIVNTMPVLEDGLSSGDESEIEINTDQRLFSSEEHQAVLMRQQLFLDQHLQTYQSGSLHIYPENKNGEMEEECSLERERAYQRTRSLDNQLCRGELPPLASSMPASINHHGTYPTPLPISSLSPLSPSNAPSSPFSGNSAPHATSSPHSKHTHGKPSNLVAPPPAPPPPHSTQSTLAAHSPSSSTLTLMKKQISEIEREIALKKPEGGRKHGEGDCSLAPKLDLHLLDPLNKKVGEPPPPPAPHPHRGSNNNNNSNIENGSPNSSTPPHTSSNSTSPSKVIGHLHSPQYTPVSVPVVAPQLLSSLGTLTSPGQVSPHMVPGHPATLEMQHKPGNGVSPSRESVEAAIADIKQAIRRTKNLPLKTHPQEKQDRGPVWIPRNNRRDLPYTKRHSSPPAPQTQENSSQIHQQDSSPSGGSNKSQERSLHEDEDGDTDQETDRLLGQQRSDEGYLDEKNWGRVRSKPPTIPLSMAPNHKDVETEVSGINSNDSSPSTPTSHQGSSSANITPSSPQDILTSNTFLPKKDKDYGKKKGRSKEVMVHEPAVLIEGVLFRARYLGSTQLVSEGQPTKTTRMMQAEEAVSRIKDADEDRKKSVKNLKLRPTTPPSSLLPQNPIPSLTGTASYFQSPLSPDFVVAEDADLNQGSAADPLPVYEAETDGSEISFRPNNVKTEDADKSSFFDTSSDSKTFLEDCFEEPVKQMPPLSGKVTPPIEERLKTVLDILDRRLDEELNSYDDVNNISSISNEAEEAEEDEVDISPETKSIYDDQSEKQERCLPCESVDDENIYVNVSNLSYEEEQSDICSTKGDAVEYLDVGLNRSYTYIDRLDRRMEEVEEEDEEEEEEVTENNQLMKSGSKQGNMAWIVDAKGGIGARGNVFHIRFIGSMEVDEDPIGDVGIKRDKRPRKEMVMEAVARLKAPEGEVQPSTEVDLFISTEKIMVLNTDLKEIMMDHALRTISYIADIGDLVVLMARRRVLPTDDQTDNPSQRIPKMICHVFESDEAQFIAQSIGQAFQVAYLEFLKANGIEDHSFVKEMDYQEVLNSQEIFGDELQMFAKKELQKEVVVPKMKGEILGVVVVESGWGSMVPTVVIANLSPTGAAAKCGQLNIGDQIIAINGISLVGLPLSNCQNYIKNTKYNTAVKLTVVPCPPVVEVKIRRPDTKYQLGFSVQNGVICSLLRGGIAERGGVRVGHRIIDINSQSVVAVPHEKIVNLLATSVGEIRMKTMPTSIFRLLTGQETPQYI